MVIKWQKDHNKALAKLPLHQLKGLYLFQKRIVLD